MKVYQKPEIRFEKFALSESIALTCSWIQEGETFVNEGLGVTLFTDTLGCNVNEGEYYCITNATNLIGDYTAISG